MKSKTKHEYFSISHEKKFKTKTFKKLKEWKYKDKNTPFLYHFSKGEICNMNYDENVYYSLECLKAQSNYWYNESKKNKYTCIICYNNSEIPIIYNCGHGVCETCNKSIPENCPMCRTKINTRIKFFGFTNISN